MMSYILLIWLIGDPADRFWHERVYETQAGCFRQAMVLRADDPNIARTECRQYSDPAPSNMG